MISQDIANLKRQFVFAHDVYGEVSYSGENLRSIIAVLRDLENRVEQLELACPKGCAHSEQPTHANIVNLRQFRQQKTNGDAA